MDLNLEGKRVLVTGASKGIGRAIARRFAQERCEVVLLARTAADLEATCADIRRDFGVPASGIAGDLRRLADIERFAAKAGAIDILVNNAGANPRGDFTTMDDATLTGGFELKLLGYMRMCRAFYPTLKARRGVVINLNGASAEWLDPDYVPGSTTNAAVQAFTTAFGRRAARDGVRVVAVSPGPVLVERIVERMREKAESVLGDAGRWRELVAETMPLGRISEPDEIAAAVAFMASPISASTTASLTIDGAARGLSFRVAPASG